MGTSAVTVRVTAATLFVVALLAAALPVCTMPDCDSAAVSACSAAAPACAGCGAGEPVLMKHGPDEGVSVAGLELGAPVALACTVDQAEPPLVAFTVAEPEQTAAPPPLPPLGVRLLI
jgi:hypothetical protein